MASSFMQTMIYLLIYQLSKPSYVSANLITFLAHPVFAVSTRTDDAAEGGLTELPELFAVIPCVARVGI